MVEMSGYSRPPARRAVYLSGVNESVIKICRALRQRGRQLAAVWWIEPVPQPRPAAHGLDIPLHPSPLARRANWFFVFAQLLFALELAWMGLWPAAGGMAAITACWLGCSRMRGGEAPRQLRRLLLSADGKLHAMSGNGQVVGLQLHPASLCLGPWLLLRLKGDKGSHVVLLGPDNMEPSALAALRRRMVTGSPRDFD
jgi:hypothetical protein